VHSHHKPQSINEISIRNAYHFNPSHLSINQFFSIGIHPWYVSKFELKKIPSIINPLIKNSSVIAIGEIGMDKLKPEFELQKASFLVQTEIALAAQLPIIVHCVKAYPEILSLLKNYQGKVILHNYYTSEAITEAFLKLPNVYFSLGKRFRLASGLNQKYVQAIPANRLFVETDQTREPVSIAYEEISDILQIDRLTFANLVESNFKQVFKKAKL
jgi:TatD DNase family protein